MLYARWLQCTYLRHWLGVGNVGQPRAQNVDEGGRHRPREVERGGAVDEDAAELAQVIRDGGELRQVTPAAAGVQFNRNFWLDIATAVEP